MPGPIKVQRRRDNKVFQSASVAAAEYGRYGNHIVNVARQNSDGIYATAYGDQWRLWDAENMTKWPEKGDGKEKNEGNLLAKSRRQASKLVNAQNVECPANYRGMCPFQRFCQTILAILNVSSDVSSDNPQAEATENE